jgi:hypothetical protein
MATLKAHAQQANHNQAFLDSIDPAIFPDWVVTAAFYKAVHLVEGLLVRKGRQSAGHYQRNGVLKRQFAASGKSTALSTTSLARLAICAYPFAPKMSPMRWVV